MSTPEQKWTSRDFEELRKEMHPPIKAVAYCYRSGEIRISRKPKPPEGSLIIARGKEHSIRKRIRKLCHFANDGKTMLVPGMAGHPHPMSLLTDFALAIDA